MRRSLEGPGTDSFACVRRGGCLVALKPRDRHSVARRGFLSSRLKHPRRVRPPAGMCSPTRGWTSECRRPRPQWPNRRYHSKRQAVRVYYYCCFTHEPRSKAPCRASSGEVKDEEPGSQQIYGIMKIPHKIRIVVLVYEHVTEIECQSMLVRMPRSGPRSQTFPPEQAACCQIWKRSYKSFAADRQNKSPDSQQAFVYAPTFQIRLSCNGERPGDITGLSCARATSPAQHVQVAPYTKEREPYGVCSHDP